MPHLSPEKIESLIQLSTRSAKNKDMTEADLIKSHKEQLAAAGLPTLEQLKDNAIALKAEQSAEKLTAAEIVRQAAEDLSEHQSVFSRAELLQTASKQSVGHIAFTELENAVRDAAAKSEIISYGNDRFATVKIHQIEGEVARVAVEQREVFRPLLSDNELKLLIDTFEEKKGFTLTRGQVEAIGYVLQHTGRIGVIQGDAGAGKSSSMEAVADVIRGIGAEQGVQVRGFALQGKTSIMLEGGSGISSGTLDSFLNSKSTWDGNSRQIWIVDEYSMVDSRRLGALVERSQAENAQVILLGDKKQLAAIGAGRLGQDLYDNGLVKTVQMDESLRQKTEYAKAIDAAMKVKDVRLAMEIMAKAGKLIEIQDPQERAAAMAKAYVEAEAAAREATGGRKGAIAMTLTNAEREAVIREVRALQKEAGTIGQQDHLFTTRAPVALDAVTRKLAASYKEGMVAIPSRAVGEIKAGSEARVEAVDTVKNTITLAYDGKSATIDARKSGHLMIYEERKTQLAEGEKITWLKSDNTEQGKFNRIKNGLSGTIEKIEGNTLTIRTELGHTVQIQGENSYITNGQVSTGHKAQGATEHTGVLSISSGDRLATENMLYVLTTRQTHDLVAFVDDKEKLIEALRPEMKASSLEEQKELLKTLTDQLRTTIEKDGAYVARLNQTDNFEVTMGGSELASDRQQRLEADNQATDSAPKQQDQHQEKAQEHSAGMEM